MTAQLDFTSDTMQWQIHHETLYYREIIGSPNGKWATKTTRNINAALWANLYSGTKLNEAAHV